MTRTIFCVLLLVATATAIAPAASAQQLNDSERLNESEDLNPGDLEGDTRLYIDGNAYIESWSHDGTTHRLEVGAEDNDTTIMLLPVVDTDEDTSGSMQGTSVTVDAGETRTRTVHTEDPVVAMTMQSLGSIEYAVLDPENDVLIGGPWTVTDARLAAIGAGLAVATMVSYKEARRRLAVSIEPEWVRGGRSD